MTFPVVFAPTEPSKDPIWLLIRFNGRELTFELPATGNRTIVVGSTKGADVAITESPPVGLFVERQQDGLCLIPGYASAELRIDTKRFEAPCHVDCRAVVELGELRLEVEVTDNPPTERNCDSRRDHDPTPTNVRDSGVSSALEHTATTTEFSRLAFSAALCQHATKSYTREELLGPSAFPTQTLEMNPIDFSAWPSEGGWSQIPKPPRPRGADGAEFRQTTTLPRTEFRARGDTTEFDRPLINPTNGPTALATSEVHASQPSDASELPAPAEPASAARREIPAAAQLARLGVLTKRHPVRVIGAATLGSMVLSIFFFGLTQLVGPHRERPHANAVARPFASAHITRPVPSTPRPVVDTEVSSPPQQPPETAGVAANPTGAVADDPEIALAVRHLIAGRLVEAEQAYRELSERHPDQLAYASLARILARRNSSDCRIACNTTNNCPMVKP